MRPQQSIPRGCVGTPEACRRSGITYRRLDYWVRQGCIAPTHRAHGSGEYAWWTDAEVARLERLGVVLAALKQLGLGSCPRHLVALLWEASVDPLPAAVSHGPVTIAV